MKILKWISLVVAGAFVIVIGSIIYVTTVLDPNDYIDNINQIVKKETNIDLGVSTVSWSFFPWLGISVADISAAHPDAGQLAKIKQVQFRLKVLPLLQKKIEIGSLGIIGAEIYVIAEKDGSLNLDVLTEGNSDKKEEISAKTSTANLEETAADISPLPFDIAVAELLIADTLVRYTDKATNTTYELSDFSLKANQIRLLDAFPVEIQFNVDAGDGVKLQQRLKTQVAIDLHRQHYSLRQLQATTIVNDLNLLTAPLNIDIKANLQADLKANTASVEGLAIQIDDTNLTGAAKINQLASVPAISANLSIDKINIDKYLLSSSDSAEEASTGQRAASDKALLIPIDVIKPLNLQAKLSIGELIFRTIPVRNIKLYLSARNGVVHLNNFSGDTLEGNFKLGAKLNVNGPQPAITVNNQLNSLQLGPLVKIFTDGDVFSGAVNFKGDLSTRGNTMDDLIANLNGVNEFVMDRGLIKGVNITQLAFDKLGDLGPLAESLFTEENKGQVPPVFGKDTAISNLTALVEIENGVARTKQFSTELEQAKADGRAEVDLVKKTLAMGLNLKLSEAISNSYIAKLSWPIYCEGSLAATPNCSVETKRLRQELEKLAEDSAKEKAKTALERKLEEKFGLGVKDNAADQDLKEAAETKLRAEKEGLQDQEKEIKRKAEEKLENKLQSLFP